MMEEKIKEIIERNLYVDKRNGDEFEFEIFCNYDDDLSDENLAKISCSEDPRMEFEEIMEDWRIYAEDNYYLDEMYETITRKLEDYDDEKVRDWISEHCSWYMPEDHFNRNVNVVISLDVGDRNFDFTKCNILNFYRFSYGDFEENSPIYWLAEQQGRLEEVMKMIEFERDDDDEDEENEVNIENYNESELSKFTLSVKSELLNACSHMNTLIFCVQMPLFDFFKLKELIKEDEKANDDYDYDNRKGKNEFIVTKDAMCGLYDIWSGGGSTLEIALEKDVVIPTKAIFDVWIDCRGCKANGRGYDVSDVYGLCSSAFSGSVKFKEEDK